MSQTLSQPTPPRALPDVNAETYPYDVVQYLLDQAANFSLLSVPDPDHPARATLTPATPHDYFGIDGGYGIDLASRLHRLDSGVEAASPQGVRVHQAVGPAGGTLRARLMFGPADLAWTPGQDPPATLWDPWRSQRFSLLDAEIRFQGDDAVRIYGIGRTFPAVVAGRPSLYAGAVANVIEGRGALRGLAGTLVMTGSLENLGFLGHLSLRLVDPEGRLRTGRELPPAGVAGDPDPSSTYVVLRGVKKDRTVKTTYGPPPDDRRVSLITPSQMRSVDLRFAEVSHEGMRAEMRVGQAVGTMDANVFFDLLAPPGTAMAPVPFTTDEKYVFLDSDGRETGTIHAGVVDGISFDLKFPAAPGQPGVRFAGFGPIHGGTGAFAGAQGMLTVNSLIGIAPHTLSLLHVLQLADPEGHHRAGRRPAVPARRDVLHPADPYHPLLQNKERYAETYRRWRRGFQKCAGRFAEILSGEFNARLDMGEFPGLRIDPERLREVFGIGIQPFSLETFDRYSGSAKGTFRTYELASRKEVGVATLYSYWKEDNLYFPDGRIGKKINGSNRGYFLPDPSPPLEDRKVDIILNSYRADTGLTSWVEIYQNWRQQRTSFAYKLPHPHEILWFVKDVSKDGRAIDDNVFMASHEWKGVVDGKTQYFMVGIFFEIDFERCEAKLHGDTFWRALYREEKGQAVGGGR
ncbi:MAG TPA: hypothetical protein DD490_26035 [Acidobacteria bacterium]|nr:hypothetical protein [Acidobacteriota bacterium]